MSNWKSHLQSEVGPAIGGETFTQRWDLQFKISPPIGGCCLRLEVQPLIGGTHVICRNQLFFEKKKRLFIADYIKPSPVFQVKCKLVSNYHHFAADHLHAVKMCIYYCHQFAIEDLHEYIQFTIYELQSSSCCTTLKDQQSGLDIER